MAASFSTLAKPLYDRLARAIAEHERINPDFLRGGTIPEISAAGAGPLDAAEAALLERIGVEAERAPVLDIGVGAGRTIALLAPASDGYVAIDYSPEMVELARAGHPGVRVEQGDARDLAGFEDESFAAVLFSSGGIDGLRHEDRQTVHSAVLRVLRPGGVYVYSTHNLDFSDAGLAPWQQSRWDLDNGSRAALGSALRIVHASRSYRRLQPLTVRGEDWGLLVGSGDDFSVLRHHITAAGARAELASAGYAAGTRIFEQAGTEIVPGGDTSRTPSLYVLARKPAPPPPPEPPIPQPPEPPIPPAPDPRITPSSEQTSTRLLYPTVPPLLYPTVPPLLYPTVPPVRQPTGPPASDPESPPPGDPNRE